MAEDMEMFLEEIISNYYEKTTGEEKKEVYKYLQKYCNWL